MRTAVPGTQTCNHCAVSDEHGAEPTEANADGPDDLRADEMRAGEIEYECSPWAQETRQVLRSLLVDSGVPHAWEGTVLVVPAAFEDQVDDLVEGARSTARSSLGRTSATTSYDVSPWSAASQNTLVDGLVEAHIPHEWDSEGDLVVHEEDAEVVEELIEALGEPDGGDELDGIALNDRLTELFVMVDRLCRDGADSKGRKGVKRAYRGLADAAVPFGVEPAVWLRLHRLTTGLVAAIAGRAGGPGDDAAESVSGDEGSGAGSADRVEGPAGIESQAAELRDLLRRFV